MLKEAKEQWVVLMSERSLSGKFVVEGSKQSKESRESKESKEYSESNENSERKESDCQFFQDTPLTLIDVDIEKLYRLMGVTVFKIENFKGIGIRLETFDTRQTFGIPRVVVLQKGPERYHVYKHNLPDYVPIKALQDQYLSTSLQLFVKNVRRALMERGEKTDPGV